MGRQPIFKANTIENLPGLFKAADIEALGLPRGLIRTLLKRGEAQLVSRGLYRKTREEPSELETVAAVAAAAPGGVICLLSALQIHAIGTQTPHEVWLALDRKARKPSKMPAKVRIVRFSGSSLTYGIQTRSILGVAVQITSPARTVVDCFRYRNKIGLDVAIESLRDAVHSRKATIDEIMRAAEVCKARTVMQRYLEVLTP